ncbi:carbohydrate ABC transporter permease [Micromonospora sp. NPDC048830]|uniref:carbohydrate ABC transporter permease n=1 Tax=Micromonospora sp. NPDC048830 TaxID=3364257 RepID=UPI00371528C7
MVSHNYLIQHPTTRAAKARIRRSRDSSPLAAYSFLAPALGLFLIFVGLPMLGAFTLVFLDYRIVGPPRFVGLDNIRRLLDDPMVPTAFGNTLKMLLPLVAAHCVLGLVLAYATFRVSARAASFYRAVIYFPTIVTTVSVAVAWGFMLDTDNGVVNYYLAKLGAPHIPWLFSSTWSIPAIIVFSVWKFVGTPYLFFLVGLQNIPHSYLEAANVDGANSWQRFRYIILPLLTPTTFLVIVLSFINYLQLFDEPFVLTGGGPGTSSTSVSMYIYQNFESGRYGYASTIAAVLFVCILALTLVQFLVSKRWVRYDND